jgi:hypothetical protein
VDLMLTDRVVDLCDAVTTPLRPSSGTGRSAMF